MKQSILLLLSLISYTGFAQITVTSPGTLEMCLGNNENICVTASGAPSNDYTFTWSTGEVISVPGQTTACINITPTGSVTIYVTVTEVSSTAVQDSVPMIIHQLPNLDINADVFDGCTPLTVNISVSTGIDFPGATLTMDVDNDGTTDYSGPFNLQPDNTSLVEYQYTYIDSGYHTFYVQATSAFGCINQYTILNYIEVFPVPNSPIDFTATQQTGQTASFYVVSSDSTFWTFSDGTLSTDNPVTFTSSTDSFWVSVATSENGFGCKALITQYYNFVGGNLVLSDGIKKENKPSLLKIGVYPNPTSGLLTINNNSNDIIELIEVTDILGNLIYRRQPTKKGLVTIDLNQPAGIYFVSVYSNNNKSIFKVMKNGK